jgi:hypothetical protein
MFSISKWLIGLIFRKINGKNTRPDLLLRQAFIAAKKRNYPRG